MNAPANVPLTRDVFTLGRHAGCDIVLDDITVSRRHAELRRDGHQVTITDLGSLNGTYVNRRPVEHHVTLADGDSIWIGKYRLLFRCTPPTTHPHTPEKELVLAGM